MKIICLSKRRPQGRDLVEQPYGRFYYLPKSLAERGHEVYLLLLGYRREPDLNFTREGMHWITRSIIPSGPYSYWQTAFALARSIQPDWIIGFSDTYYGILAQKLALRCKSRSLIDAYDNYESYIPWLKPLHRLWRHTVARADVVTAAGPQLAEWMSQGAGSRPVAVLPMAADPGFAAMDRYECRRELGLPPDQKLVGYTGSLHPNRGIRLLFEIFQQLKRQEPEVELVLSGRLTKGVELPADVHWLGYRPPDQVPRILNSLDLLLVINIPSSFGNFSYPAKLYEAMACQIPVVASNVAGTAWILRDHPQFLAQPNNAQDHVEKIRSAISMGRYNYGLIPRWEQRSVFIEKILADSS